jgi:hypothetical protein
MAVNQEKIIENKRDLMAFKAILNSPPEINFVLEF